MISSLTGELVDVDVDRNRVRVRCQPFTLELLVPAADVSILAADVGTTQEFATIFYLEGDPNRGNLEPRLIGFRAARDREFFELFTTVKGIGTRTALRALSAPVGQIAADIEARDTRALARLSGIGTRTAELIVAELAGKVLAFADPIGSSGAAPAAAIERLTPAEQDAVAGLMALGERRPDAQRLLERAKAANPAAATTEQLMRDMLRLRTTRAV